MVPHYILSEIQKETFLTAVAHATLYQVPIRYLSGTYPVPFTVTYHVPTYSIHLPISNEKGNNYKVVLHFTYICTVSF